MSPPRRIYRWPIAIIILLIVTAFSATSQASESFRDGRDVVSFEASFINTECQCVQRGYYAGTHSHFDENHNAPRRVHFIRSKVNCNKITISDNYVETFAFYVCLSDPSYYKSWTAFLVAIG